MGVEQNKLARNRKRHDLILCCLFGLIRLVNGKTTLICALEQVLLESQLSPRNHQKEPYNYTLFLLCYLQEDPQIISPVLKTLPKKRSLPLTSTPHYL